LTEIIVFYDFLTGPSTPLRPTALFSNGPGKIRNESPSMNGTIQ
jgi:hypothetical protein